MSNAKAQANMLKTLHNLYFSENKPETLQPLDLALATYLVLRQTEDHFIWDSQDTLAARLNCDRGTVKRSIDRLKAAGWIVTKTQTRFSEKTQRTTRAMGRTVGIAINLDALPDHDDRTTRQAVSEDAQELARRHTVFLDHGRKPRRRPKGFAAMQERAAQRLLDEWGDLEKVRTILNWAKEDPRFAKAVQKSLYELRRRARAILEAYNRRATDHPAARPSAPSPLPLPLPPVQFVPEEEKEDEPVVQIIPAQPVVRPTYQLPARRVRLPQ